MGVVVTVVNQKGGVAKTTTVSALAYILTQRGYRVLCIDLDPQRNLDMLAGKGVPIPINDMTTGSMLHALNHEKELKDILVHTDLGDLARASSQLSSWTGRPVLTKEEFKNLRNQPEELIKLLDSRFEKTDFSRELAEIIPSVKDQYDFILIDTNPSLTLLTVNGLYAADYVLIPAFPEKSSREAVVELWNTIQGILYYNPGKYLKVCGILLTNANPRTNLFKNWTSPFKKIAAQMNTIVFETPITRSVSAAECMGRYENIMKYDKSSATAKSYLVFADEFLSRIKELEEARTHGEEKAVY